MCDSTVSVKKPATRRTWVRTWASLQIEKRGTTWYAYRSRKGPLVIQAKALDNVKNTSKLRTVSQTLTHT